MGFSDKMFDLDSDGEVTLQEETLGLIMMQEILNEDDEDDHDEDEDV